jgi:phosphoribosylformylglycinamidine cyclo-ligase
MDKKEQGIYSNLGVSADKKDLLYAIKDINKGLFPGAFCKVVNDIAGREDYCSIFHSDSAGTKANLAYLYYKETSDISAFKGIVQDAIVMNIDDLLCVGANDKIILSNTIARNKKLITGEILFTLINEMEDFSLKLTKLGLPVTTCGGETEDVGDIIKTLMVGVSVFTTMKKKDVINAINIQPNDLIVGLASFGKSNYESEYNSGIGSNGLTLARHGTLSHKYFEKYPECYSNELDEKYVFFGNHLITEKIENLPLSIGKALLSPTRTYTPILIKLLRNFREKIHGIIHNTGGGQTKCLNFGKNIKYIKDNLFKVPPIFKIIQDSSKTNLKEMYQVFNMGHRMEIMTDENTADEIIKISKNFNVDAKIIGYCQETRGKNKLEINLHDGIFHYEQI